MSKKNYATDQLTRQKNGVRYLWRLCLRRLAALTASAVIIALYYATRGNRQLMNAITEYIVRPYHRAAGTLFSLVPFSVAELCYAVGIIAMLTYLVRTVFLVVRGKTNRWERIYKSVVTLTATALCLYAALCLLWGVYYYSDSFASRSGIEASKRSTADLEAVTLYFVELANEYGELVSRDADGVYMCDTDDIFKESDLLYARVAESFPILEGPELSAKQMVFSVIMSHMNYTGFFFPFTGEANLNIHSPACLLPATIAHEIAHQRGVAGEDEANFVAVLACLESKNVDYVYSATILAYIHLGNALYKADYNKWENAYDSLSESVKTDLRNNNSYWETYKGRVAEVSESLYSDYLQSQGQELGVESYGACVELLIEYYVNYV